MHGSTGMDLAFVADGILGGAVSFGGRCGIMRPGSRWCGQRAASSPTWRVTVEPESRSVLAGPPGAYREILDILRSTGNRRTTEMYAGNGLAVRVIPAWSRRRAGGQGSQFRES